MDRKKSRLSLSRKRKTGELDANPKRSCNVEWQESQEVNERSCCGKAPESADTELVTSKEINLNSRKRGIAVWLRKPCNPKTVPFPMCGKVVFLSKINKHLDDNCESNIASKPDDHLHSEQMNNRLLGKENGLLNSDVQKHDKRKGSVLFTKDGLTKSGECTVNGRFPEAKGDLQKFSALKISFNSDHATAKNDGVSLLEGSTESQRDKQKATNLNNGSDGTCNGIKNGDSLDLCHSEGDSSSQGLCAKYSASVIASSVKECEGLEANLRLPPTDNVSKIPTNNVDSVETLKENLEEANLEAHIEEQKDYEPYYLSNFKLVLTTVLSNEDDRRLFNEQDNTIIDLFYGMSPEEQKLYIRLFQRKHGWFRCSKLEYPKICRDLKPILDSLVQKGFLDDEHHLTSLQETLNLVAAPELKLLVKSLHISTGKKGSSKEDIIETIISLADNQKTLFGSFKSVVLKRAKQALGSCVRVAADPREVFNRVLLLFTMNVIPDDEDATNNGQAQQLSTLFLANIGKVVYPAYVIDRPTPVFHSRDSLISFASAYQQKHEMLLALESNNFEHAYSYYPEASKKFDDILAKLKNDSSLPAALLPEHLRCFTAEWAITKMCYFGVEVLQKWRQYEEAVNQLEILLQQDVFCFDSRGRWYDRLALNLHQHLKRPEKAMEVIRQGLLDPHVRFGRHLALVQRAKRILSSPAFQKGKKKKCEEFADLDLKEPSPSKSITISGTRCAQLGVFIAPEIDQDGEVNHSTKTFYAVEEYALSYYRQLGYDQGIHGEGSTFSSLYCLLMWDIIFSCGICDVFRSPFQAAPLDMCFDSYYISRQEMIDRRLEQITEASVEKLQEMLSTSWSNNEGQICAGLNWERFADIEQAKQLVACLGGPILSGIFARFAQGFRYHRSGLPDLVVWNSSSLDYRIAEVKGPGDKLSTKQQIWLEVLASFGANVEVCYVTDIGAKRLKVSK